MFLYFSINLANQSKEIGCFNNSDCFIIERGINIYSRGSSLTPEEMNDILEKASSYLLDDVIDFIENNNARKYR